MTLPTDSLSATEVDALIARCLATPQGAELLDWMDQAWAVLTAPIARAAIARERVRWSTGGPVHS